MTRRTRGLIIGVFCIVACRIGHSQAPPPELWYWHHSYLTNASALQSSMALIDQAYAAGYTGVAFWDVSFEFLNSPTWPPSSTSYLQQGMNYAISKGMKVMADGAPYGWSNDVLQTNPNWAEGQRISGARFQVNGSATQLQLVNSFPGLVNGGFESGKTTWFKTGDAGVDVDATVSHSGSFSGVIRNAPANGRFTQLLPLTPWRQYHLRMYVKTQNYSGPPPSFLVFDASNNAKQRLYNNINIAATQDWTQVDATFNSQDSTQAWLYFGEWGGSTGAIWFDDVSVEETALVNVLRRPGTPLKIYDPNTAAAFQEGRDYNFVSDPKLVAYPKDDYHPPPTVTLPAGTTLTPGQTVAMDFYAVQPIYSAETGMCLTEVGVQNWLTQNAQAVTAAVPASAGYFLGYDEMRHMNSCASCKAKGLTPGQLLAWHAGQTINLYQSLRPNASIYVWSDMFDPYHNAHDNYYLVEGDISGSWLGIPSSVTIMNWNLGDLKNSLTWFSGQNSLQPAAHRQIIAGYYDSGDGAGAAATELQQALGIPGVVGLMYTTWLDDYSQLKPFADAVKNSWASYQASVNPPAVALTNVSPSAIALAPGGVAKTTTITLSRTNYSGALTITAGALPQSIVAVITSPLAGNTGTIQLSANNTAAPVTNQSISFTVSGTGVATVNGTFALTVGTMPVPVTGGVFRNGVWILDVNGDGVVNYANLGVDRVFQYSMSPGDVQVIGDWNGDGKTKTGIFRNGLWILDANGNGVLDNVNQPGGDLVFQYTATPGDIPVVGDWNGDGRTKTGVFRNNGVWILDVNGDGVINYSNLGVDKVFQYTATPGDIPVVGDWNGDGKTKTGVFRNNGVWILDVNGDGVINYANLGVDKVFQYTATPGDTPVVGDWNGDGKTKTGVFRNNGIWIIDVNGDGVMNYANLGVDRVFQYTATPGDTPVIGDWNGDGTAKTGIFRNNGVWILDVNGDGVVNYSNLGVDRVFQYTATPGDKPLVGRW